MDNGPRSVEGAQSDEGLKQTGPLGGMSAAGSGPA